MSKLLGRVADMGAFAHLFGGARTPAKAEEKPADPAAEKPEAEQEEEDKPSDPPMAEGDKPEGEAPEAEEEKDVEEETPAEARAAERARCRAIFAAPAAANNVALAAHLAFDTDLTAEQAIGALALGGKSGGGLAARMQSAPNPSLGTGGGPKPNADSPDALAAQIIGAARQARGQKA
jgi:hypothetical protein